MFLMYRVELKVPSNHAGLRPSIKIVPNVPCGVERRICPRSVWVLKHVFLMYRVELKAGQTSQLSRQAPEFLMYRVELKELRGL